MAFRGKSINIFLIDGEASGRIKCTLANWTGIAYKVSRIDLEKCKDREDFKQSGVYFLFGFSDKTGKNVVYVGQAGSRKNGEGILNRLLEHKKNSEKNYWTEAVMFTTSNNSLGPTEISYLENRFCNLALNANRYEVKNGNEPTVGNITEEKESEMEEFIDNAKIIMGTLGHKVFEQLDGKHSKDSTSNEVDVNSMDNSIDLYLKHNVVSVGIVKARGSRTDDGFVVYRESLISLQDDATIYKGLKIIKESSKIEKHGNLGVLMEDVLFGSPSAAARFVIGKSANGLTEWKTKAGVTLKELESEE